MRNGATASTSVSLGVFDYSLSNIHWDHADFWDKLDPNVPNNNKAIISRSCIISLNVCPHSARSCPSAIWVADEVEAGLREPSVVRYVDLYGVKVLKKSYSFVFLSEVLLYCRCFQCRRWESTGVLNNTNDGSVPVSPPEGRQQLYFSQPSIYYLHMFFCWCDMSPLRGLQSQPSLY